MAIASGTCPRQAQRILAQETDGELVLLHLDEGTYFALNEVGARIWELCDGSTTVAAITDALDEVYEAPRELIEEDVRALLTDLAADQLITV